jgi:hypothetical protein
MDNIFTLIILIRCTPQWPTLEELLLTPPTETNCHSTQQMMCTTRALLTNFLDFFNKLLAVCCEYNGILENGQQLYTSHN